MFISSIFTVPLFRKSAIIIARPIAASAAATAMIKKTNICPVTSPRNEEKEINDKFMELNINSIDIKIIMAFLLTRTPITPIAKSMELNPR